MKQVFFSVVIPALNEEKFLPFLLELLAKQTYRDFEVILVDGKSADNTIKVFESYKNKLPQSTVIVSDIANVGHQRNIGAKKATGKYLVFLDADVGIEQTFLEELHIAAFKEKFLFATTWIKPDSDKSSDIMLLQLGNVAQELARALNKPFSGGYNTIVKKEIFLKIGGFREDLKINEDQDFALKMHKNGYKVTILKEPQVAYSLRRFRNEGTLSVLRKYAQGQMLYFLKSPIISTIFDYPMGGHVHMQKKRKKKIDLIKLNTYLRTIKQVEKKIAKLLTEE